MLSKNPSELFTNLKALLLLPELNIKLEFYNFLKNRMNQKFIEDRDFLFEKGYTDIYTDSDDEYYILNVYNKDFTEIVFVAKKKDKILQLFLKDNEVGKSVTLDIVLFLDRHVISPTEFYDFFIISKDEFLYVLKEYINSIYINSEDRYFYYVNFMESVISNFASKDILSDFTHSDIEILFEKESIAIKGLKVISNNFNRVFGDYPFLLKRSKSQIFKNIIDNVLVYDNQYNINYKEFEIFKKIIINSVDNFGLSIDEIDDKCLMP